MSQAGINKVTSSSLPPSVPTSFVTNAGTAVPVAHVLNILGSTQAAGSIPVETTGSGNTVTTVVQLSQAIAASDATKVGLSAFNNTQFTVDANGFVSLVGGGIPMETLSDDVGTIVTPSANNIQLVGHVVDQGATNFSTVTAGTHLLNINPMASARWIVDPLGFNGTHTTIAGAIASASSGDTIIIFPGTFTENFTVSKSLNFYSFSPELRDSNPNTIIVGKITVSSSSLKIGFSGINFTTNGDVSFSLTGNGSTITTEDCYFNATNANSISATGDSSSNFYIENCSGSFASTFTLFTTTNAVVHIKNCNFIDANGTLTASTCSVGPIYLKNSTFAFPVNTTSGGVILASYCIFGNILSPFINQTWITTAGTQGATLEHCEIYSGSSSAISVGAGTTVNAFSCVVNSSNTNAITGAGTINYGIITFSGSSSTINTTTKNPVALPVLQGGTGLSTLTSHAIQVGAGTSSLTQLAVGATGTVLTGSTGADPSFSATPTVTSITFGSGTALANYVDPTSWTPALSFGGSSTGITYSTQTGIYSRIGNIVYFSLQIVLSSKGAQTGNAAITGFPLTISGSDLGIYAVDAVQLTYTSAYVVAQLSSGSGIRLFAESSASNTVVLTNTAFANNTGITINGMYSL